MTDEQALKDAVVEAADKLVAMWKHHKVEGLPRSERNAAIDGLRNELIERVEALRSFRTPKAEPEVADEDERKWMIWYHDPDMKPELIVRGGNAEQVARQRHKDQLCAWSCHLFREVFPGEPTPVAKPITEAEVTKVEASDPTDRDLDEWAFTCRACGDLTPDQTLTIARDLISFLRLRQLSLPKAEKLTNAEIDKISSDHISPTLKGESAKGDPVWIVNVDQFRAIARSIESKARGEIMIDTFNIGDRVRATTGMVIGHTGIVKHVHADTVSVSFGNKVQVLIYPCDLELVK